jgi:hypothetical protein
MAELAPFLRRPSLCHLPTCPTHVEDDRIQAIVDATERGVCTMCAPIDERKSSNN